MIQQNPDNALIGTLADAAFREAAVDAVRRAKQTGTPVVTWKDGSVYEVAGEELDQLWQEVLRKQSPGSAP